METRQGFVTSIMAIEKLYRELLLSHCQGLNLNLNELYILSFLINNPDKNSFSDIVEFRLLPKSNVSKGVDALVKKGLLSRVKEEGDKRKAKLSLLPSAALAQKAIEEARRDFFSSLFDGFSGKQKSDCLLLAKKMEDNARAYLGK